MGAVFGLFALAGPVGASTHSGFQLRAASVAPRSALFGAAGGVRIRYRFTSPRPQVVIRVVKSGSDRVVRKFVLHKQPAGTHLQLWRGLTSRGRPAADGRYRVLIGPPGGPFRSAGAVRLHGHEFPVRAPHGTRGPIGSFGAPRSGGRTHEGFDITADCGSKLVAVRAGRVLRTDFDPVLYGNYVLIHGQGEQRSYFYAHLITPALVREGAKVRTGQEVGEVGQTGNARTTPCHLHFEIHYHGVPFDPEPSLKRWDAYS